MARITVQDCMDKVKNRFELVKLASKRAKSIASGSPAFLTGKHKYAVMALKEIAASKVSTDSLRDSVVMSMSKNFIKRELDKEEKEVEGNNDSPKEEAAAALADFPVNNVEDESLSEEFSFSDEEINPED